MKMKAKSTLLLAVVLLFLTGCRKGTTLDLSRADADPNRFIWGSSAGYDVSPGDTGLFYTKEKGQQILYYDLETKQSYVLCGQANCTHMSSKCPAYFPLDIRENSVDHLAQVGPYLYCTHLANATTLQEYMNPKSCAAYELLRINPSDGSRKVIASFPAVHDAANGDDAFHASYMGSVEYCGGWAWFYLTMEQPDRGDVQGPYYHQLTGVNLETGQVVALNQYDDEDNWINFIAPDMVCYTRSRDTVPLMTEQEFYEAINRSERHSVAIEDQEFEEYDEYWQWQCNYCAREYETIAYTMSTGESQTLFGGETVSTQYTVIYPENGIAITQLEKEHAYGLYNGKILFEELKADSEGTYFARRSDYFLLDPQTGERETVLELDNGSILSIAQGFHPNQVFPDGTFFYGDNLTEDTVDIYVYDLNTGESTFLFTDDRAITFRIFGEYNGGFFGKHKDHQDDMRFYWISKEDFYAGNLDAAIMYQL